MNATAEILDFLKIIVEQQNETRQTIFALVAALTNQPSLDRTRLSQDFVTSLRQCEANLESPSKELQALLTLLQATTELTPQLSIAARLMRASQHEPDESGPR